MLAELVRQITEFAAASGLRLRRADPAPVAEGDAEPAAETSIALVLMDQMHEPTPLPALPAATPAEGEEPEPMPNGSPWDMVIADAIARGATVARDEERHAIIVSIAAEARPARRGRRAAVDE